MLIFSPKSETAGIVANYQILTSPIIYAQIKIDNHLFNDY